MLPRPGLKLRTIPVGLVLLALVVPLGSVAPPARAAVATTPAAVAPTVSERPGGDPLLKRIRRIRIVDRVVELEGAPPHLRFFRIKLRLPVDHRHPKGPTFTVRATLLHRGTDRPTVVATSGYGLYTWNYPGTYEATQIINGNQLDLEHRFFKPSRPEHADWDEQLTIRQEAADMHQIVRAFQRIYRRPWISTGASKGGMTMTYFRRFYPDDVNGTVADVAPNDAVDADDVYGDFQANVGGDAYADCRAALVALQRRILEDRAWFEDRLSDSDLRFRILGGPARALEVVAIEVYFSFWQYQSADEQCPRVPGESASRDDVWDWVDSVVFWDYVDDRDIRPYIPYYFQAATQLGAPAPYEDEIADLLDYPGNDVAASWLPGWLKPLTFHPQAMADIDSWVRTEGTRMLFIYGEFDPWSAEKFDCGEDGAARQCLVRVVPGGNHGSRVAVLPANARRAAIVRIRRWAGLGTTATAITAAERRVARIQPVESFRRPVAAG